MYFKEGKLCIFHSNTLLSTSGSRISIREKTK